MRKSAVGFSLSLALLSLVGCSSESFRTSDATTASKDDIGELSKFLGDYELVEDKSGNCVQKEYSKIKISHPKVVTGIDYDDPNAEPALSLDRSSLSVERLKESEQLALGLSHTQISGEVRKVVQGFGECRFYRARLTAIPLVGKTISTHSKDCLQLGWELSHQMTLKGDQLTISRPHPSRDMNFECTYKKIDPKAK